MTPWWIYAALAAALILGLAIAAAIILVGSQTEERPGYIDLTGAVQRPRGRARAHPPTLRNVVVVPATAPGTIVEIPEGAAVIVEEPDSRYEILLDDGRMVRVARHVWEHWPSACRRLIAADLTETELAHQVATQQLPRGADAA